MLHRTNSELVARCSCLVWVCNIRLWLRGLGSPLGCGLGGGGGGYYIKVLVVQKPDDIGFLGLREISGLGFRG